MKGNLQSVLVNTELGNAIRAGAGGEVHDHGIEVRRDSMHIGTFVQEGPFAQLVSRCRSIVVCPKQHTGTLEELSASFAFAIDVVGKQVECRT